MSARVVANSRNIVRGPETQTVGTAAIMVLRSNKDRTGYRILADPTNADPVYHGYDSNVSTASLDVIVPGGELEDMGEPGTVHRGEVWLISSAAGQIALVEEIFEGGESR